MHFTALWGFSFIPSMYSRKSLHILYSILFSNDGTKHTTFRMLREFLIQILEHFHCCEISQNAYLSSYLLEDSSEYSNKVI